MYAVNKLKLPNIYVDNIIIELVKYWLREYTELAKH